MPRPKFDLKGRTEAVCRADAEGVVIWQPDVQPHIDGETKAIYLPLLAEDELSDTDIMKIRFFETHERRHLKFTDLQAKGKDVLRLWNVIEDVRIDSKHIIGREGEAVLLRRGHQYCRDKDDKNYDLIGEKKELIPGAISYLMDSAMKLRPSRSISEESKKLIDDLDEIKEEIFQVIENVRRGVKDRRDSTKWAIEVGRRVADKFLEKIIKKQVKLILKDLDDLEVKKKIKYLKSKDDLTAHIKQNVIKTVERTLGIKQKTIEEQLKEEEML